MVGRSLRQSCGLNPSSESCTETAGPPQKVGERITRTLQLSKPAVEKLILDMGLGPQPGLDPSPDNLVAAATFCFAPPGQQPQQVWMPLGMQL